MNEILQQILSELKELKEGQNRLEEGQKKIEKKLDSVYNHTAKITEDITESNMKIDKISDEPVDVGYDHSNFHKSENVRWQILKMDH